MEGVLRPAQSWSRNTVAAAQGCDSQPGPWEDSAVWSPYAGICLQPSSCAPVTCDHSAVMNTVSVHRVSLTLFLSVGL